MANCSKCGKNIFLEPYFKEDDKVICSKCYGKDIKKQKQIELDKTNNKSEKKSEIQKISTLEENELLSILLQLKEDVSVIKNIMLFYLALFVISLIITFFTALLMFS